MFSVLGINHKAASVSQRERWALAAHDADYLLESLLSESAVNEAMILNTCNRTEIYTHTHDLDQVLSWWTGQTGSQLSELSSKVYCYSELAAMRHLLTVGCGLDSAIIGETQVFGQVKKAYNHALANGGIGTHLGRRMQDAFAICKQVRSNTNISANPLTLASSTVKIIKNQIDDIAQSKVVILGAGETGALLAKYLCDIGVTDLTLINRNFERAERLAADLGVESAPIDVLTQHVCAADVVLSATTSPNYLITTAMLSQVNRLAKPLLIVDLAMPRDVDPAASEFDSVKLYDHSYIMQKIDSGYGARTQAYALAVKNIEQHLQDYQQTWRIREASQLINNLRALASKTKNICIDKALKKLQQGVAPEQVLSELAADMETKLLHQPIKCIRQAAAKGDKVVINWLETHLESVSDKPSCPFATAAAQTEME